MVWCVLEVRKGKNSKVTGGTEVRPRVKAKSRIPRGTNAFMDITTKRTMGYILHGAGIGTMTALLRTQ